jgi:hypothetical protein
MSVGLGTVTTGFLTVTTGLSYRNCNLARPLIIPASCWANAKPRSSWLALGGTFQLAPEAHRP